MCENLSNLLENSHQSIDCFKVSSSDVHKDNTQTKWRFKATSISLVRCDFLASHSISLTQRQFCPSKNKVRTTLQMFRDLKNDRIDFEARVSVDSPSSFRSAIVYARGITISHVQSHVFLIAMCSGLYTNIAVLGSIRSSLLRRCVRG